ncbi:unknown [Parabacteroides merdae CAG:48]|nr:unknown [Parabacteroides merdae CAG:48]
MLILSFSNIFAGNKSSRQLKKYHNEKVSNLYNTCNPGTGRL